MRITLFIAAFSIVTLLSCTKRSQTHELSAKRLTRYVKVTKPAFEDFSNRVSFVGFVEPQKFLSLHFVVPGRIESCVAKEGVHLKKGSEICRLDRSAVELEVARARNAMNAARKVMETNLAEKQKALFEAGVIGQAEFEQVRIQSETAKASFQDAKSLLDMALKKLEEHVLRAPWDGKITKLMVKPGQPVAPEIPIALFSNEDGLQVKTELHASHFNKLQLGALANIFSISSRKIPTKLELIVTEKATAVTPTTQSFSVSLSLRNSKDTQALATGVLVSGEIQLQKLKKAMIIPETSLNSWSQDGKATVYVLDEKSQLKLTDIKVGAIADGQVEVTAGLTGAEDLVTEIAPDFVTGLAVQILKEEKKQQ